MRPEEPTAVQIRVALAEIEPPVWRRLIVPSAWHLGQLHLGLTLAQVDAALAALAAAVEPGEVLFAWRPQLSDPDDEMVLDAAVNGRADALVTHNLSDFAAAASRFGLRVLTPGELLQRTRR